MALSTADLEDLKRTQAKGGGTTTDEETASDNEGKTVVPKPKKVSTKRRASRKTNTSSSSTSNTSSSLSNGVGDDGKSSSDKSYMITETAVHQIKGSLHSALSALGLINPTKLGSSYSSSNNGGVDSMDQKAVHTEKRKTTRYYREDGTHLPPPLTGYLLFSNQQRATISQEGKKYDDLLKEIGHRWRELPDDQKAVWNAKHQALRDVYEEQKKSCTSRLESRKVKATRSGSLKGTKRGKKATPVTSDTEAVSVD